MKLKLKDATIVQLVKYPGEEQCTQVLVLAALLTPPIAEKLKCREACYTEDGVPRKFDAYPSPAVRISGADVLLGDTSARANLIHKFKITQPKTGGETDTSLELRMRLHFDGHLPLGDFLDSQNKQPFVLAINARQEDLDFGETVEEDADEEDDRQESIEGVNASGPTMAPAVTMGGTHQRKRGAVQPNVQ